MQEHILVIEDDPGISEIVKIVLEGEGYAVEVSTDGDIVDDLLGHNSAQPAVIIMDIFLSGDDGRELTRKLKKTPKTRSIPVLMMSANIQADKEAARVGADDFIAKPFELDALLGKVKKYVN